jgi:hypothetical protein
MRGKKTRHTSNNKCTKHALSLFKKFLEIGTEKYNMGRRLGREIVDFGTYKPTTVMEIKKSHAT